MFIYNKYIQHFSTGHGRLFIQPTMVRDFFFHRNIFFYNQKYLYPIFVYKKYPSFLCSLCFVHLLYPALGQKKCEINFHQIIINPRARKSRMPLCWWYFVKSDFKFFCCEGPLFAMLEYFISPVWFLEFWI